MKKHLFALLLLLSGIAANAQKTSVKNNDATAIEKIMNMQERAWNEGDLDKFMEGYWNSDSLTFVGKNGIAYGWKTTLDNYKKSYPDKATMGTLTFTILKKEKLSDTSVLVLGKWHLQRRDEVGGYFTLVWKKINGQWVIISDHTS